MLHARRSTVRVPSLALATDILLTYCMLPRARQVIQGEGLIYMVLEYGDIDLARLLARHEAHRREGGATELDENFIRLYWQQMLQVPPSMHAKYPVLAS